MCGRFFMAPDANLEEIFAQAQLQLLPDSAAKHSGEISPTDIVPVFTMENGRRIAKPMIWGFPRWDGKGVIFNARQESALEKKMFRDSLLKRRIAVLTTGFYEWTPVPGQKKKNRYIFNLPGEKFMFLAGMWQGFSDPASGQTAEHFTILTTEANHSVNQYHDRMPVLLTESEVDDWLAGDDFQKYLHREQPMVEAEKK